MSGEAEKESLATEATVTPAKVTDEALAAAFDKATEVKKEVAEIKEEVEGVSQPEKEVVQEGLEEPEDQVERSRLGRRVKNLETRIDTLLTKMDSYYTAPRADSQIPQRETASTQERATLPDVVATPDDVRAVIRADKQAEEQDIVQKETAYARTVLGFAKDNASMHKEIVDEMYTNFNGIRAADPVVNAHLNYLSAKAAVLEKKITPQKPNLKLKGGVPNISTDLSVESKVDETHISPVRLDESAQGFVNYLKKTGMKEENINKALNKEMPYHLVGRK
jgi:hypothetical protein